MLTPASKSLTLPCLCENLFYVFKGRALEETFLSSSLLIPDEFQALETSTFLVSLKTRNAQKARDHQSNNRSQHKLKRSLCLSDTTSSSSSWPPTVRLSVNYQARRVASIKRTPPLSLCLETRREGLKTRRVCRNLLDKI